MEITVDASAVMAVILNEPSKPRLLARTRDAELVSAPSLPWEIGNALTALFKRRKLDLAQAEGALESFHRVPVRLAEVSLTNAVEIAWEYSIYAYDAYVIECARRFRIPLLSLDMSQREVAVRVGVEVMEV